MVAQKIGYFTICGVYRLNVFVGFKGDFKALKGREQRLESVDIRRCAGDCVVSMVVWLLKERSKKSILF